MTPTEDAARRAAGKIVEYRNRQLDFRKYDDSDEANLATIILSELASLPSERECQQCKALEATPSLSEVEADQHLKDADVAPTHWMPLPSPPMTKEK